MGKFNPQKEDKLIISLRLPRNKVELIDGLATKRDISRNEFLMKCIDYALDNIDEKKGKQ
jgi:uncharacterized protein (DUF1778 family)